MAATRHLPSARSTPPATEPLELWTISDLIDFLPWRRSTVYELTRRPGFPAALALPGPHGSRRVWLADEVRAWVRAAPRTHVGAASPRSADGLPGSPQPPAQQAAPAGRRQTR